MNVIVTGHRIQKLGAYDHEWIKNAIEEILFRLTAGNFVRGFAGMASGVDLWFCEACKSQKIRFVACVPFSEQSETMSFEDAAHRNRLMMEDADEVKQIRNSQMLDFADRAIVVWDGNKGGTHNVVQQLVERKIGFYWINPVAKVVWECFP